MLEKLISALPAFIHYSVVKKPKSRTYKNNSNWFNVYYFLFILRNFLFPTCNTLLIKISEFTSIESIFLSPILTLPASINLLASEFDLDNLFSVKS